MRPRIAFAVVLLCVSCVALAQSVRPGTGPAAAPAVAPAAAPSRIAGVTVYQGTALVTREVTIPQGMGLVEVTVTPLPAQTIDSSLYTEGGDGMRVLSTRYRTRAVK